MVYYSRRTLTASCLSQTWAWQLNFHNIIQRPLDFHELTEQPLDRMESNGIDSNCIRLDQMRWDQHGSDEIASEQLARSLKTIFGPLNYISTFTWATYTWFSSLVLEQSTILALRCRSWKLKTSKMTSEWVATSKQFQRFKIRVGRWRLREQQTHRLVIDWVNKWSASHQSEIDGQHWKHFARVTLSVVWGAKLLRPIERVV